MANLLGRWLPKSNPAWKSLEDLAISHVPVRIEMERLLDRFLSPVTVLQNNVVFVHPNGPDTTRVHVDAGDFMRVLLPGDEKLELRMEVTETKMMDGRGDLAIYSRPVQKLEAPRRRVDRYNVRRFGNLKLELDGEQFRLLDLSSRGCKIAITPFQSRRRLPVGSVIRVAVLSAGQHEMSLERLVPRTHIDDTIGCEFRVRRDGMSDLVLSRLLATLHRAQGLHAG
jgi:hypothetical protein